MLISDLVRKKGLPHPVAVSRFEGDGENKRRGSQHGFPFVVYQEEFE
jgi:hypothetical protein